MLNLCCAATLMLIAGELAPATRTEFEALGGEAAEARAGAEEVPIGRDRGDRMTVAVQVAGRGPYRFLVDTGAERTVISRQLAERLRLAGGADAVVHSVVGPADVATVHIPELQVSSNVVTVTNAPALEAGNIGADGMLGVDSLQSQRILFDFKAGTMAISSAAEPAARLEGDTVVVRARSRHGRLIFTQAMIDGRRLAVLIDTGSQVTIGNRALQRSLERDRSATPMGSVLIETVTGQRLTAEVALVGQLQLGGVGLDDLAVAFTDAHIFDRLDLADRPALLLGMNALRAFDRISIDFAERKVRFVLPRTSQAATFRLALAR